MKTPIDNIFRLFFILFWWRSQFDLVKYGRFSVGRAVADFLVRLSRTKIVCDLFLKWEVLWRFNWKRFSYQKGGLLVWSAWTNNVIGSQSRIALATSFLPPHSLSLFLSVRVCLFWIQSVSRRLTCLLLYRTDYSRKICWSLLGYFARMRLIVALEFSACFFLLLLRPPNSSKYIDRWILCEKAKSHSAVKDLSTELPA